MLGAIVRRTRSIASPPLIPFVVIGAPWSDPHGGRSQSELSAAKNIAMLQKHFRLRENGTSLKTETVAGVTTFMTLSYIIFVQPTVLSSCGMDFGAVLVATCISGAIATIIMGLYANYPVALAPGMGQNFFFAYTVVLGMGISWEKALGAVFISGVLFLFLSSFP